MDTFYGFKIGQKQDYDSAGKRVPITMVRVEALTVINSNQVAFGTRKHINKPTAGLLKNLQEKISPKYIKKLEFENKEKGTKIAFSYVFTAGDMVKVSVITKGKGFAGVIKRHGFKGGPKTHGQSNRARHPGSIGQTTTPGRVYRGKRMAGHMGNVKETVVGLEIFAVQPEENLLLIKGLVPGVKGGLLTISK